MPSKGTLISHNLKDTAVYWGSPTPDGWGGRTFADGIEIDVRWEDRQEMFVDPAGREIRSQAVVYTDRDLALGGYLYLGTLHDLSSDTAAPETMDDAMEIKKIEKVPSLKIDRYIRKVWL